MRRTSRITPIAAIVAGLLALSGCAGSNTAAAPKDQDQISKLVFAHPSVSLSLLPMYVAEDKGYFTDSRVNVEFIATGASNFYPALFSGDADIVHSNITDPMTLRGKGQDVMAVGTFGLGYNTNLVFSKTLATKDGITATSPLLDKIRALKGTTISVTGQGAGTDTQLRYLLGLAGLDYNKDLTVTYIKDGGAALAAFESGQIDGFIHNSPWYLIPVEKKEGILLANFSGGEVEAAAGYLQAALVTTPAEIKNNATAIQKFLTALTRAMQYIRDSKNLADVTAIAQKYLAGTNEADTRLAIQALLRNGQIPDSTVITKAMYEKSIAFNNALNKLSNLPPVNYEYSEIVDPTLANKALESVR